MPLTLASNAITFTDNTALSSGIIGTAQLSAGAVTASKVASNAIFDLLPSGSVLQTVTTRIGNLQTISTNWPYDDTIPNTSSGSEVTGLSATITPYSTNNKLLVRAILRGSSNGSVVAYYGCGIFRDSIVDALATGWEIGAAYSNQIFLEYLDAPATVSPVVYKIRAGCNGPQNLYINGSGTTTGVRKYGGTAWSTITVQEIKG